MLNLVPLGSGFGGRGLAFDGALDSFLGGLVVVFLNLGVIIGFPMDEHADADEDVVCFIGRNDAFRGRLS